MPKQPMNEEGLEHPLGRGRSRYQKKDYPGALEAFKEAVELSTGNILLTALDYRAATYEKLDKLQAALRDSKQMIDLKPEVAKGYLRCAKVLQLKGENELALKIYERGLNKVKIGTDNDRPKLQSSFNKLRQAQNPGKSLDPLEFLPLELVQMVIQNLRIRDRVICLAISKPWKRFLESSHKLWTTFDTTYTRRPISQNSLKLHLKRSNYTLDKAVITMRAKFDATKMKYLTRTCKKLRFLEISGSGVIGDSLTAALPLAQALEAIIVSANCEISLTAVQTALKTCQLTLVEATFLRINGSKTRLVSGQWPQLQYLKLLHLQASDDAILDITQLLYAIPSIRHLILNDWHHTDPTTPLDFSKCKELQHLDLTKTNIQRLPIFPSTLRHLNLSKIPHLGSHESGDEAYNLPFLESFDCNATTISAQLIKAITLHSINAGSLRRLCMGDRLVDFRNIPIQDEYPASNTVEDLSLASLIIKEQRILEIVNLYPNLQKLDVSGTKVTGVAVKHFVHNGIKWLKLNECSEVSPDAVEYARGKDVDVEFNFPSRSGRVTGFRDRSLTEVF